MWTQALLLSRGHPTAHRHRERTGKEGSRITGAVTSKVSGAEVVGDEMPVDARGEMLSGAPPESSRPADEVSYGPFSPLSPPPHTIAPPFACTRGEIELRMSIFCSIGFIIC